MDIPSRQLCLTLRPTQKEFSRPFCDYVKEICAENPGIPMFKVVAPEGWKATSRMHQKCEDCIIETPIRQNVIGSGGAFKCVLEEYRKLSVADMERLATSGKYKPPPTGRSKDDWLEREFWSSVSINPPIYGADTPESFFDEKLPYGWNLQNLGDLMKECDVPRIPGVTSPMVYFGMWKSFFSWHVEDVDLYSINYLHFGAPKVWYCVAPGKEREKFEQLARSVFPHDADKCPAFLRHKEFLISPKTLRSHGIKFVQAKQEAGEFIVLNAGAYHCGYNLGFNCAEAVNFATSDWLELGETASKCTCRVLSDPVTLDMSLFRRASKRLRAAKSSKETQTPSPRESHPCQASSSGTYSEESDSEDSQSRSTSSTGESNAETGSSEEEEQESGPRIKQGARTQLDNSTKARATKMRPLNELSARFPPKTLPLYQTSSPSRIHSHAELKHKLLKKSPSVKPERRHEPVRNGDVGLQYLQPAPKPSASHALAKLKAARGEGSKRLAGQRAPIMEEPPRKRKRISSSQQQDAPFASHHAHDSSDEGFEPSEHLGKCLETEDQDNDDYHEASEEESYESDDEEPESALYAVIGEDEKTGQKFFHLVQKVKGRAHKRNKVRVESLKAESDGLYRRTGETWEEAKSALVPVRSQAWHQDKDKPPGYRLLTLKYRILETDLMD